MIVLISDLESKREFLQSLAAKEIDFADVKKFNGKTLKSFQAAIESDKTYLVDLPKMPDKLLQEIVLATLETLENEADPQTEKEELNHDFL